MKRSRLIETLTENIIKIQHRRPLLVAIDGRDAAGKSTLAKELAENLRKRGVNIIEVSIDGFHNPRAVRYRRGRDSPKGYYLDSFNHETLKKQILDPLKTGDLRVHLKTFDYKVDEVVESPLIQVNLDAVLVFDGVFSLRPELRDYWDYSIYLQVDEAESIKRGVARDRGDEVETRSRYLVRYVAGQRLYHSEADPVNHASVVVDNNDPENPRIL